MQINDVLRQYVLLLEFEDLALRQDNLRGHLCTKIPT